MNKQIISPDGLCDLEGAAAYLLVTRRYLRAQCKAGWITHVKLNRTAYRFTREDLDRYIGRYTRKSKGPFVLEGNTKSNTGMQNLSPHPLAECFPLLPLVELQTLALDIAKERSQRTPGRLGVG